MFFDKKALSIFFGYVLQISILEVAAYLSAFKLN